MGAGGRRFKSSLLDQFRRVAQLGQRTCLGRTGSVVRIHSRRPVCLRRTFCGVAKSVRRPPVKREIAGSSPAATANFAAGRSGSPGWSHNPSLAGSTPASATKVRGRSGRDEELRHRFSSGRGLVAWVSAFQADDVSSILTVRSKLASVAYETFAGPESVFESPCPL